MFARSPLFSLASACGIASLPSLLVKPLGTLYEQETLLRDLLLQIRNILQGDFRSARPVQSSNLIWRWPPPSISLEARTQSGGHPNGWTWCLLLIWTGVSALSLRWSLALGAFRPKKYRKELILNSDFKKFDETLRMVIDCDENQEAALTGLLERLQRDKKICFGLHRSSNALMTCIVHNASGGQHIHFIDGADGGYALAALQLKKELKAS